MTDKNDCFVLAIVLTRDYGKVESKNYVYFILTKYFSN